MSTPPPTIPADESQWATWIETRKPAQFKVHKSLTLARSALGGRSWYESFGLYQLLINPHTGKSEWHREFYWEPEEFCECGNRFKDVSSSPYSIYWYYTRPGMKMWNSKPWCRECHERGYVANASVLEEQRAELGRLMNN